MVVIGLGFVLGIVLGSFVDCIASRSVTKETFWGRSYCDECKKILRWYDLFPVLSFLILQGKCRFCHKKLSIEFVLVELLVGIIMAYLFSISLPQNILFLPYQQIILIVGELLLKILAVSTFISVLITDIKTGLIPDRITYPTISIYFAGLVLLTIIKIGILYQSLMESPLGKYLLPPHSEYFLRHVLITSYPLIYGALAAFLLGLFFLILILVTRGRGMGGGDLKLGIFIGLVLGIPHSLTALMLAFLSGSIVGVGLILFGKKKFGQTIPFGPFLSLGAIAALFWGDQILNWYLNIRLN